MFIWVQLEIFKKIPSLRKIIPSLYILIYIRLHTHINLYLYGQSLWEQIRLRSIHRLDSGSEQTSLLQSPDFCAPKVEPPPVVSSLGWDSAGASGNTCSQRAWGRQGWRHRYSVTDYLSGGFSSLCLLYLPSVPFGLFVCLFKGRLTSHNIMPLENKMNLEIVFTRN